MKLIQVIETFSGYDLFDLLCLSEIATNSPASRLDCSKEESSCEPPRTRLEKAVVGVVCLQTIRSHLGPKV